MQNTIKTLGPNPPLEQYCRPCRDAQILSGYKKPKRILGPRPNATMWLFRGLTDRKTTSATLEASPPRPQATRPISASLEAPSAEPSAEPRRGGKLRLIRDPPRHTEAASQPPDGTSAFIANHSMAWSGSQTASAATPHSGRDRRPVRLLRSLCRYSRRGADLRNTVRTCLTLPRLPLVLSSPTGPLVSTGDDPRTRYGP
jgi:hypothetical protein